VRIRVLAGIHLARKAERRRRNLAAIDRHVHIAGDDRRMDAHDERRNSRTKLVRTLRRLRASFCVLALLAVFRWHLCNRQEHLAAIDEEAIRRKLLRQLDPRDGRRDERVRSAILVEGRGVLARGAQLASGSDEGFCGGDVFGRGVCECRQRGERNQ
jgi:hypothetical protein